MREQAIEIRCRCLVVSAIRRSGIRQDDPVISESAACLVDFGLAVGNDLIKLFRSGDADGFRAQIVRQSREDYRQRTEAH